MREISRLHTVRAPLRRDSEVRRWYADGAGACVALTRRGRLLEPHPVFGPTSYRLLALNVSLAEADRFAREHAFWHARLLPAAPASG